MYAYTYIICEGYINYTATHRRRCISIHMCMQSPCRVASHTCPVGRVVCLGTFYHQTHVPHFCALCLGAASGSAWGAWPETLQPGQVTWGPSVHDMEVRPRSRDVHAGRHE